ncbi:MAG TPA: DUF962 domain-containing protein [Blastocatellia bacterium]|nr:DUF962 domain-containing protein [Blastocatellia bacterium]
MNQDSDLTSFQDFWPFYVREHSKPGCRLLHFIGSSAGLVCLILTLLTAQLWWFFLGLLIGYGMAWIGHFFIEKNRPATFKHPLWSLMADWKMWWLTLQGRMTVELDRARPGRMDS